MKKMKNIKILSEIAMKFISSDSFDLQIKETLELIGNYFSVSRVYIFIDSDDGETTSNTYEWCANGVESEIYKLQNIGYKQFPNWREELIEKGMLCYEEIDNLDEDLREFLNNQNIKSLVIYPIYINKKYKGFIGFDECFKNRKWIEKEFEMLKIISGIISTVYEKKMYQDNLKLALNQFKILFDYNPEPMAINDYEREVFLDVNQAFLSKMHYKRDDVIGKTPKEIGITSLDGSDFRLIGLIKRRKTIKNARLEFLVKEKQELVGIFSGEIIEVEGIKKILTVMNDISEEIKLNKELEIQKQRLEHIIEGTHMGTWEWNIPNGTVRFNERWAEIIGYTLEELEPITIETWIKYANKEDLKRSNELLQKHFRGETPNYDFEGRMKHKNGNWIWILDRGRVMKWSEDGKPIEMFGTHTDITEKKKLQNQIEEMAIRDGLTGIYNRRYIFDRLRKMYSEYKRTGNNFSVAIIDIDYFKKINDNYGHIGGDHVLKEFTKLIQNMIRDYDLLGRYGGEEFIVVFPNTKTSKAAMVVERILNRVRQSCFRYSDKDICFTFSAGVYDASEISGDSSSIEEIIEGADNRLYKAKRGGRDNIMING
jgi:diguanylate cyclase (GGDEF)-like protein/PAS domain S-box-containing protein